MNKARIWLAAAASAAIATTWTATAQAAPVIAKVSNTAVGEAGYFINDNGHTRIRDVQVTTTITAQMENLNGTGPGTVQVAPAQPGGVGVELCNENTGYAAQLGLEWDSKTQQFIAEYGWSSDPARGNPLLTLTSGSDPDPCAEGGLLSAGAGETFANFLNAAPVTANGAIHLGDVVHFEVYYDPQGHWQWLGEGGWQWAHKLKFLIQDQTQNVTRVQTVEIPAQNFYEAGIGVVTQANSLTGGAVNLVNGFTGAFFNWYQNGYGARFAPRGIVQPSHWDLELANFVNGSNQVTLTPSGLSAGNTAFSMLEGSTSA